MIETVVSENDVSVSWDNPFTTNLTFCVDARSVDSSETVMSKCVYGMKLVFTSLNSDLCEDLSFTVTPTVTVEGVQMNGTSSKPVVGYFRGRRGIPMHVDPINMKGVCFKPIFTTISYP